MKPSKEQIAIGVLLLIAGVVWFTQRKPSKVSVDADKPPMKATPGVSAIARALENLKTGNVMVKANAADGDHQKNKETI